MSSSKRILTVSISIWICLLLFFAISHHPKRNLLPRTLLASSKRRLTYVGFHPDLIPPIPFNLSPHPVRSCAFTDSNPYCRYFYFSFLSETFLRGYFPCWAPRTSTIYPLLILLGTWIHGGSWRSIVIPGNIRHNIIASLLRTINN